MIRVNVLCEDRTGGGLAEVLARAANAARAATGKPPIVFPRAPGTLLNNRELIRRCGEYDLLRFRYSPRFDHVYYVIDAKRLWDCEIVSSRLTRRFARSSTR